MREIEGLSFAIGIQEQYFLSGMEGIASAFASWHMGMDWVGGLGL